MQNGQGMKNMCGCPHHKVLPILIILFGITFLLGNWGTFSQSTVNFIWPVLVIVGGFVKLTSRKCKCC